MPSNKIAPHILIIMGGTGDLMRRKLLPAIYSLSQLGHTDECCQLLAVARKSTLDDAGYRAWALEALKDAGVDVNEKTEEWCNTSLFYHSVQEGVIEDYLKLSERLKSLESERKLPGNRIFYLALPPSALSVAINNLGNASLNKSAGWTRVVVEKPFGRDLNSAQDLNALMHRYFNEAQIYRIDHYLGKETVKNLLVFRFANDIFESLWNRKHIQSVQITMAEAIGIEKRGEYYDHTGALRDMIQSHVTQLLTLIAMEPPSAFEEDMIRFEKTKVLRSISPIHTEDIIFGQYTDGEINGSKVIGYRQERDISSASSTETFAALRLDIENWRWQGVPFYIRTGKRLPTRLTQIAVVFRRPPVCMFQSFGACMIHSNVLQMTLQPNEGFSLFFDVKAPGTDMMLETRPLLFKYHDVYGDLFDAYHALLLDIMEGDQTLFVHKDEVEAAWRLYTPVLDWKPPVHPYAAGSWGPVEADRLIERNGHGWFSA